MDDEKAYVEEYCTACHKPLPPNSLFCASCGPPQPPPRIPGGDLTPAQAILRIGYILAIFVIIISFKVDFNWSSLLSSSSEEVVDPEERPQDGDLKVIHYVKVDRANVRDKPSTESNVITVVAKGEKIAVIEKNEEWTKVDLLGKTGWIATDLLTATVE